VNWVKAQAVPGLTLEVLREKVRNQQQNESSIQQRINASSRSA
jgi:hypothetical protein